MKYRISTTPSDGIQVLETYEPEAEGWYTIATLHEPSGKRDMEAILAASEQGLRLRKTMAEAAYLLERQYDVSKDLDIGSIAVGLRAALAQEGE